MNDPIVNTSFAMGSKLIDELSKLSKLLSLFSAEISSVSPKTVSLSNAASSSRVRNKEENFTEHMLVNFEAMLGFTGSMLEDMGLMDSGFGKMLQSLMQFVSSLTGDGDIISIIGGIFGSIIGLFSGPAGIAAGAGSAFLNSGTNFSSVSTAHTPAAPVIVHNTIKNPVTFRRALEIETRVINNLNSVNAG